MKNLFNLNLNLLKKNIIDEKKKKDFNKKEILEIRKTICKTSNLNIINEKIKIKTNSLSNPLNTVFFISFSEFTLSKIKVIEQLCKTNYFITIGFDTKYFSNKAIFLKKLHEKITNLKMAKITIVPLNYHDQIHLYGKKIINFNGKWKNNPAKFGSLHWFFLSKYQYMWYLEDDVYCKNWLDFLSSYNKNNSDLICNISELHIPNWAYDKWRIGDDCHAFDQAHLYVARYSKQFIKFFFEYLTACNELTSHHELFIPYILNFYHLKHTNLIPSHREKLFINNHFNTPNFNFTTNNINKYQSVIFHPFKF